MNIARSSAAVQEHTPSRQFSRRARERVSGVSRYRPDCRESLRSAPECGCRKSRDNDTRQAGATRG